MRITKIAAIVLLVAVSLAIVASLRKTAFPLVAVDFTVPRKEVPQKMLSFLATLGGKTEGYKFAVTFGESDEEKNFIEREHGTAELQRLEHEGLGIWYWAGRWFKPDQHEDFRIQISPQGALVDYWHMIDEAAALPFVTKAAARAQAEKFLRDDIGQHPFDRLTFVADSTEKRTHRTDYTFTWQRKDLSLGDALYEVVVTIKGNTIGGYSEGLKIPEWWTRKFARERQVNELFQSVASFAALAIVLALVVSFILTIRRGDVRWTSSLPWGWLLVFGIVELGVQINGFATASFNYNTTQSWPAFVAQYGFGAVRSVLLTVAGTWLLFVIVEPVYRRGLPGAPSFRRILGADSLRQPGVTRAIGVGIVVAVVSLAYQTLFYVVGSHFGVWSPIDIDAAKALSGWLPWIEPAMTGLTASSTEELLARVAAILLIWKLVRVRWIAVVLSAAVWGFLHSNYPQLPGYIRGVEITVVGVAWGFIFLRYGLIATLTAHYLFDCWLGSTVVFASASPMNLVGAVAVSAWPIAIFLWARLRKPALLEPESEADDHPSPQSPPHHDIAVWNFPVLRLSAGAYLIISLLCATALAVMAWLPQKQAPMQKFGTLKLSRESIGACADEIFRARGYDPAQFQRIVSMSANSVQSPEYLLEHGSLKDVAQLFGREWHDVLWSVRYFRFLQPEEFQLMLDKSGKLIVWKHQIPPEAPGAQLTPGQALAIATMSLRAEHGVDLSGEESIGDALSQQARRRDYHFAYERRNFGWGEAKLRTGIIIQGNEPTIFYKMVRVPEKWRLEHAKSGWQQLVKGELRTWITYAESVILCVLVVILISRHLVPWRLAFVLGLYAPALALIDIGNRLPWFFSGYQTTAPVANYVFNALGGDALGLGVRYLAAVAEIGVALGLLRWAFGFRLEPSVLWPRDAAERGRFLVQTAFLALASAVILAFASFLVATVKGYLLPAEVASFSSWIIDESHPWISALVEAVQTGADALLRLGILAGIIGLVSRRFPRAVWAVVLAYPLLGASGESTWREFWIHFGIDEFQFLLTVAMVVIVWRFNITLVFAAYALNSLFVSLWLLWFKSGPAYQWQILPVIGVCAGLAVLVGAWHLRGARAVAREMPPPLLPPA